MDERQRDEPARRPSREDTDPLIAVVLKLFVEREQQLNAYANSGKFPPFAVEELKVKAAAVRKEKEAWEKRIGRKGSQSNRLEP